MPHQCTNCDRLFADGSKEMLSGCPGCGGNKFQFLPSAAVDDDAVTESKTAATTSGDETPADGATGKLQFGHASGSPRNADLPVAGEDDEASTQSIIDADARASEGTEDSAQADARRTVISEQELRAASEAGTGTTDSVDDREPVNEPSSPEADEGDTAGVETEASGLSALREELNEQFESIKILEPGQYELNLMELYDREEYIIALEEDGRYAIEVPDSWREADE